MKNLRFLILCMILALCLPYTYGGCAGGGGGGGSDGMVYSGLTDPSEIDESNAEDISGGAFGAGLIGDGMLGFSLTQGQSDSYVGEFRTVKLPLILSDALYLIDFAQSSTGGVQSAVQTVRETINGSCGGSMSYSVSADDVRGTFNGSFTFSEYCNDGTTINGSARFNGRMNVDTGEFLEAHFSFDNLSGGNLTLDGDIEVDFTQSPDLITFNAYGQDPGSGKIFWIRDYSITIDDNTGFVEIEMAGRFYHPDFGYATISTTEPFVLHDGDEWPTSGALIATGANSSKAKITAIDNLYCIIEADADGDGSYEWDSGTMAWDDI
ncbi:MAG: hypothetical protein JSW26_07570 [Desulfobacterales bacterium]|nr:MAG: hypothetical protein JSW26_07570 [Desulfobacterales bacterium]